MIFLDGLAGMSAIGHADIATAAHMSAFGGKADMTVCGVSLSRSLSGVKRTWVWGAPLMADSFRPGGCIALEI